MIRAAQREISRSAGTTATFPAPAPAGSFLRFNGVGSPLQVSFDGGRTWAGASPQAESRHALGFENYWTPVPAGTTRVALRGGDWYGGPWYARDLSIWSQAAPPAPAAG